jgi:NitT/TauT family transport system substrate-binding protein
MRTRFSSVVLLAAVLLAAVLVGTPAGAAPQLVKVKYGLPTSPPVITTAGAYFALEQGFFRQEGLDVEIVPYPGSVTVVRALLSRQVDIALTDPATTFLAYVNGAPLKIIAGAVEKGTDVVVAASGIGSIADLKGKRFGISDPGGQGHSQARLLAAKHGLNPDDIQYLAIGGPVARAQALLLNRVDATSMTILILKPILEAIDAGRVKVLTSLGDEFPDLPTAYDITRDDMIRERPLIFTRFLRAEIRGYRWAQQNPDAAAQVAGKYIREVEPAVMVRGIREISKLYGVNGGVSAATVEGAQRLLVQLGIIRRVIDAPEVLATQFVDQAVRTVGR